MALTVKLPEFEGPLDLLLHLIKDSEMNIYDIPIVAITSQYMDYLHSMQQIKLEIAGDYFVMAATLMRIKSQWLLPQPEEPVLADEELDNTDPRDELVTQLLTYQTYKQVATELQGREQERQAYFSKAPSLIASATPVPMPEQAIPLTALTAAFTAMLQRQQPQVVQTRKLQPETITVAEKVAQIKQVLQHSSQQRLDFTYLLSATPSIEETVTTFMAVLELMKNKQIACFQAQTLAPITVALKEEIA